MGPLPIRWLVPLLWLMAAGALAVEVDISALPSQRETALAADFLEDPGNQLSWADAANRQNQFQPLGTIVRSFGVVPGSIWFRTVLRRGDQATSPVVLVSWGTLLNHLDVRFLDPSGRLLSEYRSGDAVEADPRLPRSLAFQFPVPNLPEVTVLTRIETQGSLVYQLYLWDQASLARNLELQNLLLGLLFGFLALMVAINLLFRLSLRDTRFLWYAAYVASLALFFMVYSGWIRSLTLPWRFPQDVWDGVSYGLLQLAAVWFCRKANRLQTIRWNGIFTWSVTVLSIAGTVLGLVGAKNLGLSVQNAVLPVLTIGCWVFALVKARQGFRFSWFYLGAWSLPVVGALLVGFQAVAASNWDGFNPYYLLIGSILAETMVMTFAFSDEVQQWHRTVQARLNQSHKLDRLAALGLMASRAGHEVNTPSHVIGLTVATLENHWKAFSQGTGRTASDRLKGWEKEFPPLLKTLKTAQEQIRAVSDELLLGGVERPKPFTNTDLGKAVSEAIELHRLRWEGLTRRLNLHPANEVISVSGNPMRLGQMAINLIDNALEALDDPDQAVRVRLGIEGEKAFLVVEDQGRGMGPTQLAELGRPFQTTKPDGHGLGWGICQQIAREHRGTLSVSSSLGRGTQVRFEMPLLSPLMGDGK